MRALLAAERRAGTLLNMRPTVWIVERAQAEADALRAEFRATRACLDATLDTLDEALASGGLEAAAAQLEGLSGTCRSAAQ